MIIRKKSERKPRKLTLSPTKINTYLACRLMYKYTYIDKLNRFYYKPKLYNSFGLSLHRTLEEYHKQGGAQTQSAEQLVEQMHQVWSSLGYETAEEEQAHIEAAAQFLEQYHTASQLEEAKTLFTEKSLKYDMGEFNLTGRIDRLDEHLDRRLEVVDYKSGRLSVGEDEVRNDLAMRVYAYLTHKNFPDQRVTASIYCLRTGNKANVEFSDEELAEVEDGVRAVALEIAQIDADSVIDPAWLPNVCPGCDYLRLCARRAGWDLSELLRKD